MTMRRAIAASLAVAAVGVGAVVYASTPAPTTPQEWCRVTDLATGEDVTVPCYRDPTTTTTLPPTTTTAAPTTTTQAPTTTAPPPSGGFVETFDGNTGLDRFRRGVYHRDGGGSGTWPGDHDRACNGPDTQRWLDAANPDDSFYLCRDHMMTSVGHVSAYSIAWLSPDQTFLDETTVSWDVNVTDLGGRQWWEVMIVPVDGPDLTCHPNFPCGDEVRGYPADAVIVGNGPFGGSPPRLTVGGVTNDLGWKKVCNDDPKYALDAEGCASKAIRRPWSITDNQDGTLTVEFHTYSWTVPGAFPAVPWKVVFKDHNYTPDKGCGDVTNGCFGYTWHWDNIVVR